MIICVALKQEVACLSGKPPSRFNKSLCAAAPRCDTARLRAIAVNPDHSSNLTNELFVDPAIFYAVQLSDSLQRRR